MSEALTPKLTREQYRIGYLNNMGKEIANEAYNLAAVASYLTDGESVGDAINQSATLTQGIPLATLKAVNAVKYRSQVENSTAAIHPLNLREQQFIYTYSDAINQMIRSGYRSDRGGGRISAQLFRQIVSDMMRGAMNHVPQYNNVTVPDAVEGGTQTTNASSQFVDEATQMESMGVPSRTSSSSSSSSSRFSNPFGYDADSSSSSSSSPSTPSTGSFMSLAGSRGGDRSFSADNDLYNQVKRREQQEAVERGGMSANDVNTAVPRPRPVIHRGVNTRDSDRMTAGPIGVESGRAGYIPDESYTFHPVYGVIPSETAALWDSSTRSPPVARRRNDMPKPRNVGDNVRAQRDLRRAMITPETDPTGISELFPAAQNSVLNSETARAILSEPARAILSDHNALLEQATRRSGRTTKKTKHYNPTTGKGEGLKCCGGGIGKPLAPFGNYLIDLEDLKNSHLSLYTAKGNKQRKVPRQVIGGNVSNVLKSLVIGQRPRPKDILSLNEDEREYLNGVGMAAKIEDLQDMPTKKKTETQKDMHECEVLKGQIAAGNDNKELIQDFKRKLLKMIHAKKVSKTEGHDLLLELASMGI